MDDAETAIGADYAVGYCRPPVHTRFQPGVSGNPAGRAKGSKNFKTLFDKVLNEQISLQDGTDSRKITKAEAIVRRLIIGAMKGDSRSQMTLFRMAELTGQFEEAPLQHTVIERVIVDPRARHPEEVPAISEVSRDEA